MGRTRKRGLRGVASAGSADLGAALHPRVLEAGLGGNGAPRLGPADSRSGDDTAAPLAPGARGGPGIPDPRRFPGGASQPLESGALPLRLEPGGPQARDASRASFWRFFYPLPPIQMS